MFLYYFVLRIEINCYFCISFSHERSLEMFCPVCIFAFSVFVLECVYVFTCSCSSQVRCQNRLGCPVNQQETCWSLRSWEWSPLVHVALPSRVWFIWFISSLTWCSHYVYERFHTQVFAQVIFKTKYFQGQDGSSYLQSPSSAPGTIWSWLWIIECQQLELLFK